MAKETETGMIDKQKQILIELSTQCQRLSSDINSTQSKALLLLASWVTVVVVFKDEFSAINSNTKMLFLVIIFSAIFLICIANLVVKLINSGDYYDPPGLMTASKTIREKNTLKEYNELIINDYRTAYKANSDRLVAMNKVFNLSSLVGTISILILIYLVM